MEMTPNKIELKGKIVKIRKTFTEMNSGSTLNVVEGRRISEI